MRSPENQWHISMLAWGPMWINNILLCLYQVRVITVFTVFRLLTDFVCLYTFEFWLSLCYYPYLLHILTIKYA
jgi:hypothetical protein